MTAAPPGPGPGAATGPDAEPARRVDTARPRVTLIVAATEAEVIGDRNDLPWHLPADLPRFKRLTMGHTVVVGRLTHESIVRRLGKPMPGRQAVVVTRGTVPGFPCADSVPVALEIARRLETGGEIFVIGGAQVYVAALPFVDRILLTRVHADIAGDTALPTGWLDGFTLVASGPGPVSEPGAASEAGPASERGPGGMAPGPAFTWLTYERG